jgi:hypothetical protein
VLFRPDGDRAVVTLLDEPGFTTGTMLRNLFLGALSKSNAVPQTATNDVALALGFSPGDLYAGDSVAARVMISEAGHTLGSFALSQRDIAPSSTTVITLSGQAVASEVAGRIFNDLKTNGIYEPGEGLALHQPRII